MKKIVFLLIIISGFAIGCEPDVTEQTGVNLPLSMYPNPARGNIFIVVGNDGANFNLKVFDRTGKQILNESAKDQMATRNEFVIESPGKGTYYSVLTIGGKEIKKMVIHL